MEYVPSTHELEALKHGRVSKEVREMLSGSPLNFKESVPIKTEEQAREYLLLKIGKYQGVLPYAGSEAVKVDKYIAKAMNTLLTTGFTYANLYAKSYTFLTEPHVASALAFNSLHHINPVPDEVDLQFGLTYK